MSSDEEDFKVNKASHKKLLSEINDIVKFQHIKKPKRTEPAVKNDEFHLIKTKALGNENDDDSVKKPNKKNVAITALANLVRKNESQKKISSQFQETFKKTKVLKKPLEKIHADRIQRSIAYDSTKNKLSKWDAIVTKNKNADQLKFPLNYDKTFMDGDDHKETGFSKFRYKTKMVQEMEAIHNECFPKDEEPELLKNDSAELLTLEEMKERRKELGRLKMRESYQITKKRLQGKIKSKKYHRLKKREDIKQKLKEFEELKAINPEAALKELEKIDKQRIQERVNLRHKNTGTWAKNMKIRAKYDTNAQQEIEAQLQIARDLTQKQQKESSDSDSDEEMPGSNKNADNPWLNGKNPEDEDDIFGGYRKFWEEKNANEKALKKLRKVNEKQTVPEEPKPETNEENGKIENSGTKKSDEEQSMSENDDELSENSSDENTESQNNSKNGWIEEDVVSSDNEDPSNFINDLFDKAEENINKKLDSKLKELKPKLLTVTKPEKKKNKTLKNKPDVNDPKYLEFEREAQLGDIDEALNEGSDDQEQVTRLPPSKKLKNEIQQLKEDKKSFMRGTKDEIDPSSFLNVKSKHLLTSIPKTQELDDVDEEEYATLAAANKMSLAEAFENDDIINDFIEDVEAEASKNQKTSNSTLMGWGSWAGEGIKEKKRKFIDRNPQIKRKDRVIVNTTPHESLKKHLISSVPFPFTTIKDFQASMRAPIGKDFNPSSAHSKLTMESVITKAGTIIEPMSEEALVKTKDERKKRKFMKKPIAR
ncbi:hypothetical protein ACKWTF_013100 [Chironomus riparius]